MLTYSIMGTIALWILWGNTLLVALAAAKRAVRLHSRSKWMRPRPPVEGESGIFRGRIASADGGSLAEHSIDQLGRVDSTGNGIVWHDRSFKSSIGTGEIVLESGERLRVSAAGGERLVWCAPERVQEVARCKSGSEFEDAYPLARRVKGFARTVSVKIGMEEDVFIAGRIGRAEAPGASLTIEPFKADENAEPLLILATHDPRAWCRTRAFTVLFGFVPAIFAGAAVCTLLATTAPVFTGHTSKLGGLLGLVFFLVVLPAGTMVRDWMREPSERFLRGRWSNPQGERSPALVNAER